MRAISKVHQLKGVIDLDRHKFSEIAHCNHVFYNPINDSKLMKIIEKVPLQPEDKVIDVGSGQGELLIRLVENYNVFATGIEIYDRAVEQAKRNATSRVPGHSIDFIADDASKAVYQCEEDHKLGVCIGSTHALNGLASTLQTLKRLVKKDGYILVGEGYWKQPPSKDYLEALGGADESELTTHAENVRIGEEMGLTPIWSYVASEEEWDDYEWLYSSSVENYCRENPNDPDGEEMLERIRAWRRTYLNWGRDTMGFGLYLFRNSDFSHKKLKDE